MTVDRRTALASTGVARAARACALAALAAVLATVLASCAGSLRPLPPTPAPTPGPTASVAILQARAQLEASLRLAGIGLIDARRPYRPPEPPTLVSAPRSVFQAVLPADADHGDVVVYDLGDVPAAAAAGRAMASYLASGPTRVQFAPDARFVLRQLGSTLVFYTWSPANTTDPSTAGRVADVLGSIGSAFGPAS